MRCALMFALVTLLSFAHSAPAGTCYATNATELHEALLDYGNCTEIIIPELDGQNNPVVIEVPFMYNGNEVPWFSIGDVHEGLHLTIDGTIKWVGGTVIGYGNQQRMIQISDASGLRIDGKGRFTSIYEYSDLHQANEHVAVVFRVLAATDLQIEGTIDQSSTGLHFDNVDTMILVEGSIDGGTFKNLRGTELFHYGMYLQESHDLTIENCHVGVLNGAVGTYELHGFRFYDANNLQVINCTAYNISNYGIWPVTGNGVTIDGFSTDHYCNIGPNTCPDGGETERLFNVTITNFTAISNNVRIEQGTWHCSFEDSSASSFTIGRDADDPGLSCFTMPRPIDRIHWRNFTVASVSVADNPDIGDDRGEVCLGDIDSDGHVNVTDLLAVINGWGPCSLPYDENGCGIYAHCPCYADIAPAIHGDNAVNVNDLLAVINAWGDCPSSVKGNVDGVAAYCIDYATNTLELEPYSEAWNAAVKDCIENYE